MPLILFHGEDSYSIKQKVNFWKQEFAKKHEGDMNLESLDGKDMTPEQFRNAVTTLPFLGEKRFVVVKNVLRDMEKERQKEMAEVIKEIPDFCVALFYEEHPVDARSALFHRFQKFGKVEEFAKLNGTALLSWIFKKCRELNTDIDEEAALSLAEHTGGDLYRLENEIQKLGHFVTGKNRPIRKEDVVLMVDTTLDTSIFRLTDSLAAKHQKSSINLFHQLIDMGQELHYIFSMIVRQFRIIIQVKELLEKGHRKAVIAEKTGINPYVVSLAMGQASNFSFAKLKRLYAMLLDIDTRLKTGGIKVLAGDQREFLLALDKFILDTCRSS